jgi:hypothetical protein
VPDNLDGTTPRVGRLGTQPTELVADAVHRRARRALVVNLVVAICCFGLLSIPGAAVAGLALRAIPDDLPRADRMVRWSWAFLGANLLFYLLLAVVVVILAVIVFLASRSGT